MNRSARLQQHRERQGTILMLLLLAPAPISLILAVLGSGTAAVAAVLVATTVLVATMLVLHARQRRDAYLVGLPVLPMWQVVAMLGMVGGIGASAFLLPHPSPDLAKAGLVCAIVVVTTVYAMGARIRPSLSDPDERSVVMVLGLMVALIALANACV